MKSSHLAIAMAAIVATAACNGDKTGANDAAGAADSSTATSAPVAPPASGDWTEVVTATDAGGFMMGNPNAKVKLIEFASMTCPHCARFDKAAYEPLTQKYVKTGQVAYELRNFVRDPFDVTASLVTRCGGAKTFFPLTNAMYADQENWVAKIQAATPEQQQALGTMGPEKEFAAIADLAGFKQWAAMRGIPAAKIDACLTDQKAVNQLVQMNNDAVSQFNIPGTPSFVINGKLVEMDGVPEAKIWPTLESKIKAAL
jgi:protein-disulfide isomerase